MGSLMSAVLFICLLGIYLVAMQGWCQLSRQIYLGSRLINTASCSCQVIVMRWHVGKLVLVVLHVCGLLMLHTEVIFGQGGVVLSITCVLPVSHITTVAWLAQVIVRSQHAEKGNISYCSCLQACYCGT